MLCLNSILSKILRYVSLYLNRKEAKKAADKGGNNA